MLISRNFAIAAIALLFSAVANAQPVITTPPAELKLSPFYKKYMDVNGLAVCSSERVPDSCFHAAYITFKALTEMLPQEVMQSLIDQGARVTIMA